MGKLDCKAIGDRIREKRLQEKMTQENLAEKVGKSAVYIGEIERGKKVGSLQTVADIAKVLKLNLDSLVNGINRQNANQELSEILDSVPDKDKDFYVGVFEEVAGRLKKK